MKGAHSPVADATLTTQLPDAGAVPRVVKEVEGETLPFFEDETALGHLRKQHTHGHTRTCVLKHPTGRKCRGPDPQVLVVLRKLCVLDC
jgi:hypothetical protein